MVTITPSHEVVELNEQQVLLRGLELFCGYDPGIDDKAEKSMSEWTKTKVRKSIARTLEYMERDTRPKMVVRHQDKAGTAPQAAVGDIVRIAYEERRGVPFVVGDVVMQRDAFERLIASNAYPRRSAEIWEDGFISEVALLGRETPARPLPDTRFQRFTRGDRSVARVCFDAAPAAHPGAANTAIPTVHEDDDMDEMTRLRNENARLKAQMAALTGDTDEEKDEFEGDDEINIDADEVHVDSEAPLTPPDEFEADDMLETEDDEDDEEKAYTRMSRTGISQFAAERARSKALHARIRSLEDALVRERFERVVDGMIDEGFDIATHRDALVGELMSTNDPEGKVAFWRSTFKRTAIGRRFNMAATAIPEAKGAAGQPTAAQIERASRRARSEGKPTEFARILREEMASA